MHKPTKRLNELSDCEASYDIQKPLKWNQMKGILNIWNRTENWMTASTLASLFEGKGINLVQKLGENSNIQSEEVRLELFWKGIRDWLHMATNELEKKNEKMISSMHTVMNAKLYATK